MGLEIIVTTSACEQYTATQCSKQEYLRIKTAKNDRLENGKLDLWLSIFIQLESDCHTGFPSHSTCEQCKIPISIFHFLNICGIQCLPFHHFVDEHISGHIRKSRNISFREAFQFFV